ncbi:MAG: OB-fold nucleic acid binding domain-containing protein [Candidatus Pacearchaeota archaeon]|nr:OB-fold nucleic acid binding domain-containing protein [Candidatus Pacearchaeota archaeon]
MPEETSFKRHVAYKLKIGDIISGKPLMEGERFKCLETNNKQVVRVNLIANIIDKFIQEAEDKKYAYLTLDDASGQIRIKAFGDDIEKFSTLNQGDTILVIGLVRIWNNEIYITPEIIKKKEPLFLLIRKMEIESSQTKTPTKEEILALKDKLLTLIKNAEKDGGINTENLILELKEPPEIINQEIKKLLEDGIIYEPRPGKIRYLG